MHGILLAVLLAAAADPAPRIAATRAELRQALKEGETEVPPAARLLVTRYKHQLRDYAAAAVASAGTPAGAQGRMAALFRQIGETEDKASFSHPNGDPSLIAATTTIKSPCAEDGSLYLFRRGPSGWRLILSRESNGYEKVSGALGVFGFRVSPPDAHGRFFVVTANITPWCVSNWQMLRFEVLRPGQGVQPRALLRAERSVYLPSEYELSLTDTGFHIEWSAEMSLDQGRHTRTYVERYTVDGDRIRRIPPLAKSAMDFVDVWNQMPWAEAARYGPREGYRLLGRRYYSEFGESTQNADGSWSVPLDLTMEEGDRELVTFTVEQKGDDYRITKVDRKPLPEEGWRFKSTREELWKALGDEYQWHIPPAARPLLTRYKHELRDIAARAIAAAGNPEDARRRVTPILEDLQSEEMTFSYPTEDKNLIAAKVDIFIPCGRDASLYLFRRQAAEWRLILARESSGYETAGDGLENFQFKVSPPDAHGDFFVVTANQSPGCESNWRALRFDVLRVGQTAKPRVLLRAKRSMWEREYELTATTNGFRIEWPGPFRLDFGRHHRGYVEQYTVNGSRVERVPPMASRGMDFIDEWAQMPWAQAKRYGGTREVHGLLHEGGASEFAQEQEAGEGLETVALDFSKDSGGRERMTFTTEQKGDDYRIVRIDREPLPEDAFVIKEARDELWQALPKDEWATDIPPAARPLLARYKRHLRELAWAVVAQEGDPERAEARADRLFEEMGVQDDGISFAYPNTGSDLIAATVSMAIPCGSDTALYLFRREENRWRLILAREGSGYKTVADALGVFGYGVSPADERGGFFVVTANVNPWCSSNWQSLRFDVLRPGPDPDHPRVLLRERRTIFDPWDSGFQLTVTHAGFRLGYLGDQSLDTGILVRDHVDQYAVAGNEVRRLPPLAADAIGFVDEWKELPWPQASRYGGTREIHDLLQRDDYFSAFDPAEKGEGGRWSVPLWVEREHGRNEWIMFTVKQKGDEFRLINAERTPVAR